MTPEETLNAQREKSRARQQRFKERVIEDGGIEAYRAKMAEYRRRYRAKKALEKATADSKTPDTEDPGHQSPRTDIESPGRGSKGAEPL